VSFRSREISIRIALGLAPASAARLVLREGVTIVVAGTIAGLAVFVVFSRLLASLAFEVSPIDVAAVLGATFAVGAVATLSTWIPARRASRADPAAALRSD